MCYRERLHVTACGKIADLSSWPTFKLHRNTIFWKRFQVFLYGATLGFVRSRVVSSIPKTSSIGFTVKKKTACLPLLRLFPPGIHLFLIIEFNSLAFPTWLRYSINPFGIHISLANLDQWHFLLNVLEVLEGTGIGWESLDSHNIGIFSLLLGRIHFHPKSISSNDTFIQTRFHPMTLSSKHDFIQWHFHPNTISSNDTFIQTRFHPVKASPAEGFRVSTRLHVKHRCFTCRSVEGRKARRVILAYMCVKLQMRLYVCHRVGPFGVHFGSMLGPCWVHFGSILGPFRVHLDKNQYLHKKSVFRQELLFKQECSLDKNSSLDC